MTKEQFKAEWEKDDCKITFDDIAKCAIEWGISSNPKIRGVYDIRYKILKAANCSDAEKYKFI